jgi:hypothetical protein
MSKRIYGNRERLKVLFEEWTKGILDADPKLMLMSGTVKCPKCGKMGWLDHVTRFGKGDKPYHYLRYRHPLDGRTKRNKTCYVRDADVEHRKAV